MLLLLQDPYVNIRIHILDVEIPPKEMSNFQSLIPVQSLKSAKFRTFNFIQLIGKTSLKKNRFK